MLLLLLAACANQFEATYDPAGTWTYAEMKGAPGPCSDELIAGLEEPVELTGAFPEFESADVEAGSITMLGTTVDLEIDAATAQNTSKGHPVDDAATYTFGDTTWSLTWVIFDTKHSCTSCKDEVVVELFTPEGECNPWPVYRQ